eukprot:6196048-Pleurochrysis_carterae.AAC.3
MYFVAGRAPVAMTMGLVPASQSYSQRRAAARGTLGRGAMPLAHSFRVSWGPGGIVAFGSRSLQVVDLQELDAQTRGVIDVQGEASAEAERVKSGLMTIKRTGILQKPETMHPWSLVEAGEMAIAALKAELQLFAQEHESPRVIEEQHTWKLVAATLSGVLRGEFAGGPRAERDKKLQWARMREALRGWLEATQQESAQMRLRYEAQDSSDALWCLASTLQVSYIALDASAATCIAEAALLQDRARDISCGRESGIGIDAR